jgi:hypothetical protein
MQRWREPAHGKGPPDAEDHNLFWRAASPLSRDGQLPKPPSRSNRKSLKGGPSRDFSFH